MKIFFFAACTLLATGLMAQKNVLPVAKVEQLNIDLPSGSKQDKRLISVSAGKWVLDMEAAKLNYALDKTEVYILPSVSASGFNAVKLASVLQQSGWVIGAVPGDNKYALLTKEDKQVIVYFDMAKKETSLYVAACIPKTNSASNPQSVTPVPIPPMPVPVQPQATSPVVNEPGQQQPASPTANEPISQAVTPASNSFTSSIAGIWINATSSAWSNNDPAGSLSAGYTKHQYIFNVDGTYTFYTKQFLSVGYDILLVRETGNYFENGNQLEIIPASSVIETWSKKDGVDKYGTLKGSRKRELERVTYTFTKYYFQGLQEWSLVLQAQQPTQREGQFSSNDLFKNAYYYKPASSTNTPVNLPGQ